MSLSDTIYGSSYLLKIAITIFIGVFIWASFASNFTSMINGTNISASHNQSIQDAITNMNVGIYSIDYMFPFIVFGLMLVSLILAFKTGSSVIYAMFSLILWVLALIVSGIFTNVFGQFELTFPTVAASLPIITYLMNNMKWIVLAWLFLITIVMFSRNKKEQEAISASEMAFGQ